jgi:hypothetical protein
LGGLLFCLVLQVGLRGVLHPPSLPFLLYGELGLSIVAGRLPLGSSRNWSGGMPVMTGMLYGNALLLWGLWHRVRRLLISCIPRRLRWLGVFEGIWIIFVKYELDSFDLIGIAKEARKTKTNSFWDDAICLNRSTLMVACRHSITEFSIASSPNYTGNNKYDTY